MTNKTTQPEQAAAVGESACSALLAFSVVAGKYDGEYTNCKYSLDFVTFDEAIEAYDSVSGYPWRYMAYEGRVITIHPKGYEIFER